MSWGATIAQWIRLSLPTCCPRFESQAHHLRFYQFKFQFKLWHVEKTKISRKRGRDWPIFKKNVYGIGSLFRQKDGRVEMVWCTTGFCCTLRNDFFWEYPNSYFEQSQVWLKFTFQIDDFHDLKRHTSPSHRKEELGQINSQPRPKNATTPGFFYFFIIPITF